jgi:hypothetical protein
MSSADRPANEEAESAMPSASMHVARTAGRSLSARRFACADQARENLSTAKNATA